MISEFTYSFNFLSTCVFSCLAAVAKLWCYCQFCLVARTKLKTYTTFAMIISLLQFYELVFSLFPSSLNIVIKQTT